ncbi:hypothetical protein WDW37_07850 [Bdellovibrionota bacterium FG-1]
MVVSCPNHLEWPHQLRRKFRLIIFDWDSTAALDRKERVPFLAQSLTQLLQKGIFVVIVTGTKLDSVLGQLNALISNKDLATKQALVHLFICTYRGSEVWSFSAGGHFKVGLMGKSDSVRWVFENVVLPNGMKPETVAVVGDELNGQQDNRGSDGWMQIPELEDATFFSVGAMSRDLTEGILSLGGGPSRFQQWLAYQAELGAEFGQGGVGFFEGVHEPTSNPSWLIEQEGFDPSREHEMESLFSIGNGFLGVRGSTDLPIPSSQSELYLAGIYDHKAAGLAYSEPEFQADDNRTDPYAELVLFPSPFRLRIHLSTEHGDAQELCPGSGGGQGQLQMSSHERILDMKQGLLFETFSFTTDLGCVVWLRSLRMASLVDPHLLLHELEIQVTHVGQVSNEPMLMEVDAAPPFLDFSLSYPHLKVPLSRLGLTLAEPWNFETSASRFQAVMAAKMAINGMEQSATIFRFRAEPGHRIALRSMFSVFSNRDENFVLESAKIHLQEKSWESFDQEIFRHVTAWKQFWKKADLRFSEQPALIQAHRYGLYQLRSAAPTNDRSSVGARGLTGRAYEGHVFWDAEIFVFPFYLFMLPEAAKNILLYRYRTLSGARKRAAALGYQGACYAWESTVDGADVTPSVIVLLQSKKRVPIFTGFQQIHITADIAYAVFRYWDLTGDDAFVRDFGAEILIETARFWVSRVSAVSEKDGRVHILGVVGPDEYHHDVNDNAYTNWMARLNLKRAAECVAWLEGQHPRRMQELRRQLGLQRDEIQNWKTVAELLYFPEPNQEGIIEQFDGFFSLSTTQLSDKELLHAPVNRLLNWEAVNRLRVIKQADVLMIPFLFPGVWPKDVLEKNYRYYSLITDHGSSLSPGVHAAIAADLGLKQEAEHYWDESLNLDLQNLMQNTSLGIHLGCMGGTWQALFFHFLKKGIA